MKQTIFFLISTISTVLFAEPVRSMLGADGSSMVKIDGHDLPDGIVAVEYIESTGTQYIITPFLLSGDMITEICAAMNAETPNGVVLAGARNRTENVANYVILTNGKMQLSATGGALAIPFDTDFHIFYHSQTELSIDEKQKLYEGVDTKTSSRFVLFAYNYNDYITLKSPCRIRYAKFGLDGEDGWLIAVRFTNENGEMEGAMYDLVSGELFLNQGTGDFIIGPDL